MISRKLPILLAAITIAACGDEDTDTPPHADVIPLVEVADQTLTVPEQLTVARAVTDGPGWIVIHDDNSGEIGVPIGFAPLAGGSHADIGVELERDAIDGETLYAMLHTDAGMVGSYEFPGPDTPVVDDSGNVIAPPFVVTVTIVPAVEVNDQVLTELDRVSIANAVSDGPGWIVIHQDNAGAPGAILGHAPLSSGSNADVSVTLDREATDGETLFAMLHIDAGMVGTYEFPGGEDVPVVDDNEAVVMSSFTVSHPAVPFVNANDQTLADLSTVVTVASASSASAGWLVVHADDGGVPGMILGKSALSAGETTALAVELTRPLDDGEILFAMLHIDAGTVGMFEFPGEDAPVTSEGTPVMQSFEVAVPAGTPAARIQVTNVGASDYDFTSVTPSTFTDVIGSEMGDQTLSLTIGWRYEVVNSASMSHPFELSTLGGSPAQDAVLLSQASMASFESDGAVEWVEDGNAVIFTVTGDLGAALDGYRCAIHQSSMRGSVAILTP